MMTVLAFLVALTLLIAVHEYGHYRMAVACGVKVLRFSVGFGRVLWRWQRSADHTEFVVCALPLGGYVRMLDEREAPVPPELRHLAFNRQGLHKRSLIVVAGPLANLALAVLLYAGINWGGVQLPSAVLPTPVPASMAQLSGLQGGELVVQAGFEADDLEPVLSFDDLSWWLTRGALQARDVHLQVQGTRSGRDADRVLPLSQLGAQEVNPELFRRIGILGPYSPAILGELMPDGAALRDGLRPGDRVLRLGDTAITDGRQLRELIRQQVNDGQAIGADWQIERQGQALSVRVTPEVKLEGAVQVGRIGAMVGAAPAMTWVHYGPAQGLWRGAVKTWEVSALTLRMMGRMVVGEASVKNLSGPLTIADYAGRSASLGWSAYLGFLALISVSLGVLNLLPLPVLDGGHLMYYLWEALSGRAVSDAWLDYLQRAGVAILTILMAVALFNDLTRLLG
jgi:regulator of sigma E protease